MMLRELVQNALEAAAIAEGRKQVRVGAAPVEGSRKLRIWNSGPGMDAEALFRMCDLSSSIGKIKGLHEHFGIGAKVASLPTNHHGVRYRSCTGGRVSEVILGKRDGVYGRLLRPASTLGVLPGSGRLVDVLDVTEEVRADGASLDEDWTEVVLLGMTAEQDTVADPYAGAPAAKRHWLAETLYHRYFDIPAEVEVMIEPDLHWFDEDRPFRTLRQRSLTAFAGYEAVQCEDGVTLHYLHDPAHPQRHWENASSDDALQTSNSLVAVVWRNEMYDVRHGSPWLYEAPTYGFTFAARHLSLLVELDDDYPVVPDGYRQFLRYAKGEQAQVRVSDFATLARERQPAWIRTLSHRPESGAGIGDSDIAHFAHLASRLNLDALNIDASADRTDWTVIDKVAGGKASKSGSIRLKMRAACGVEPVLLRDAKDVRDRWLEGRAACFYPKTKQLFINTGYGSVRHFADVLSDAAAGLAEVDVVEALANEVAEAYFVRRLVRATLFGMAKHLQTPNWSESHIDKAISPEALSTVGDDLDDFMPSALAAMREQLAPAKRGAEPSAAAGFSPSGECQS